MKSVVLVLLCLFIPAAVLAQSEASRRAAEKTISSDDVYRHIEILAHDSMRGRGTPSPELDSAAEYVAAQFNRIGLLPGSPDGGFIQRYPLVEVRSGLAVSFEGRESWEAGVDIVQNEGRATEGPVSGPLVVVTGVGVLPHTEQLQGAIVMLAARWEMGLAGPNHALVEAIQRADPAAVIVATEMPDPIWTWFTAQEGRTRVLPESALDEISETPPTLFTQLATAQEVLAPHGVELLTDGPASIRTVHDLRCTVQTTMEINPRSAPNVVGILPGSDAAISGEYLVLSAHLDHLGVGRPVEGDSIRNGADDNASGIAGIIEVAEATAMLDTAPRRSIIFLAVSGEELGLWGSDYFADHPSVPISSIVANVNTDMIGRNWTDTIAAIGKERSSLGETLDDVAGRHPELNMAVIDDIWPDEGFYSRSDQHSFAQRGVPALYLFNGPHEDYHGVGDETEKINVEKASRIVKLLFHYCLEIANDSERPKWK